MSMTVTEKGIQWVCYVTVLLIYDPAIYRFDLLTTRRRSELSARKDDGILFETRSEKFLNANGDEQYIVAIQSAMWPAHHSLLQLTRSDRIREDLQITVGALGNFLIGSEPG
jgi:hypothetical protein